MVTDFNHPIKVNFFPLVAKALSSILMFHLTHSVFVRTLAQIELALLVGIIVMLVVRTVREVSRKAICVAE